MMNGAKMKTMMSTMRTTTMTTTTMLGLFFISSACGRSASACGRSALAFLISERSNMPIPMDLPQFLQWWSFTFVAVKLFSLQLMQMSNLCASRLWFLIVIFSISSLGHACTQIIGACLRCTVRSDIFLRRCVIVRTCLWFSVCGAYGVE